MFCRAMPSLSVIGTLANKLSKSSESRIRLFRLLDYSILVHAFFFSEGFIKAYVRILLGSKYLYTRK